MTPCLWQYSRCPDTFRGSRVSKTWWVFITGHNANVLPCHLYHFTAQNGTKTNTREFYKISGWNMKASFCCLAGSLKGGITPTLVWNPSATKSQAVHLTNVLSSLANNSFQHLNWTDWKGLKELLREKSNCRVKRWRIKECEMIETTFGWGWVNNL